jgi:hypothetical protein
LRQAKRDPPDFTRLDPGTEPTLDAIRRLSLCIACIVFAVSSARAMTLTLSPADTTVGPGDGVVLRVISDAATDIKGVSLELGYSVPRLAFVSAHAGGVITQSGNFSEFVLPDVVAPADSVGYDAVVLTGTGSGPGVVVFLGFTAGAVGTASVDCLFTDVRDSQNGSTQPACSSSTIHVAGPVPTRKTRWSTLKSIYR